MRRFVFILLLVFLAGFSQAQDKTKYKTGSGDGYDGSRSEVYIESIFQEEAVCEGEDALFSMQVEGSMLYSYRWYKVGAKQTTLSTESFLLIKNCVRSRDNGAKYMCEVTDLNSNETTQPWDTFRLTVLVRPVAKLNLKTDTTLCYGQTLNLSVTPNDAPEYIYTWFGDGIVGSTYTSQVTVMPSENTHYEVTVGNGVCASEPVGVQVNVVRPEVTLSEDIIYTRGESVAITPLQSGTFDWYVSYGVRQSNVRTFTVQLPDTLVEATVSVAKRMNGCTVSDSLRI
nr:immunoglobulin domain-containing protein [Odoribacter sp.]